MEEKDKDFTCDQEVNYIFHYNTVLGKRPFYEWINIIEGSLPLDKYEKETVEYKINPEELEEKCGDCRVVGREACLRNDCKNRENCFIPGFGYPPKRGRIIDYTTKVENDFCPHFEMSDLNTDKGVKHNQYKLPMSKLFKQFPRALQAVILTSCYGHNKYKETDIDWMNFSRVDGGNESYFDADIRHQLDREIYGDEDESGLPHIFHEAFDKLAKCELWIKENNIDIKDYAEEYLKNLK